MILPLHSENTLLEPLRPCKENSAGFERTSTATNFSIQPERGGYWSFLLDFTMKKKQRASNSDRKTNTFNVNRDTLSIPAKR